LKYNTVISACQFTSRRLKNAGSVHLVSNSPTVRMHVFPDLPLLLKNPSLIISATTLGGTNLMFLWII